MDRNRVAGFGFVLFGLSLLRPILTAGSIGNMGVFNLLMAVGGLALASSGAWMVYRGGTSEVGFVPSRRDGTVLALAATSIFIGAFAYAFVG
jgi:hypothetical protein